MQMNTKRKMTYFLFIALSFILLAGCACCSFILKPDPLSLPRVEYTGTNLRIDGYYYEQYTASNGIEYMTVLFFYRNGILLEGETFPKGKLPEKEQNYLSEEWINVVRKHRDFWGVFHVTGNNMKFEKWYPSERPTTSIREGVIFNDTTFRITKVYRPDGSNLKSEDRIYLFKAFSPKPDSTNRFIP